jgi:DnaJ-class molecular chaperone
MNDPYKILGVERKASAEEIKKAYRKLAKKLHPDLHPGDEKIADKFKQLSSAYGLLSDAEKRARFDRGEIDASGQERQQGAFYRSHAEGAHGAKYQDPFGFAGTVNIDDVLGDLFARRRGQQQGRRRGSDVSYTLMVSFLDAVRGAKRRIRLPDGKSLEVTIPEGTEDRQTLRLKGQGGPGIGGGSRGDAYVEIHIKPHPFFVRKDTNIHIEIPVSLPEAVLGGSITVPTISGKVSLKLPKGSNTGSTFRLKGKGVCARKTKQRGDQYVKIHIMLPDQIDPKLESLVKKWAKTHPYEVRSKAGIEK